MHQIFSFHEMSATASFFKFLAVTITTQVSFTFISNYYLKSRKNFKQTVKEMRELNIKLDSFNSQFALSPDQTQQMVYAQKQLEKASMHLSRNQLLSKTLMFLLSFFVGKIIGKQFSFEMDFKAPFPLFFPLSFVLQKGAQRGTDQLSFQAVSFLVNQSIRRIIGSILAVKLPRSKMPITKMQKKIGGDDAQQFQDMMSWFI